jgi:hypothetical protein
MLLTIFTTRHVRVRTLRAGNVVAQLHVSSYNYICVLIPLYMCPHTTIYLLPGT